MTLAYATDLKPMLWNVSPYLVHPDFLPLWDSKVLHLPMWEGGGAPGDVSGKNHLVTLPGGSANPTWVTTRAGLALRFDGSNDFITPVITPISTFATPWTLICQFIWNDDTQTGGISLYSEGSIDSLEPLLQLNLNATTSNIRASVRDDAATAGFFDGSTTLNEGQLYVGALVNYGAAKRELFLDGRLEATNTTSLGVVTTNTVNIGKLERESSAAFLNGDILSVARYDRILTAVEIALYSASSYGDITQHSNVPGMFGTLAVATGNPWYAYAQQH